MLSMEFICNFNYYTLLVFQNRYLDKTKREKLIYYHQGEWFNGKTAAFKVADLGSNPCSPAEYCSKSKLIW